MATIHDSPVAYAGGTFVGYTIIDPVTGAGAYKIGGGENGGIITLGLYGVLALISIVVTNTVLLVSAPVLAFMGVALAVFLAAAFLVGFDFKTYEKSIDAIDQIAISLIFTSIIWSLGFIAPAFLPIVFALWVGVAFGPILFDYLRGED